MSQILRSTPGKIARLNDSLAIPAIVKLRGLSSPVVLITGISHQQAVNAQMMSTLQNVIYIYTTGDRVGTFEIHGVAFADSCHGPGRRHGLMDVYDFYDARKVSNRRSPVIVTVGDKSIVGVLVSMQVGEIKSDMLFANFTLTLATIPEESTLTAASKELPDMGKYPSKTISTAPAVELPQATGSEGRENYLKTFEGAYKQCIAPLIQAQAEEIITQASSAVTNTINSIKDGIKNLWNNIKAPRAEKVPNN